GVSSLARAPPASNSVPPNAAGPYDASASVRCADASGAAGARGRGGGGRAPRRAGAPDVVSYFPRSGRALPCPGPPESRGRGGRGLSVRLLAADGRVAKAAIYGLNHTGRHTREWEEARTVFALVREDGLTQVEAAELPGRHKSWVCRRLALVERLADPVKGDL